MTDGGSRAHLDQIDLAILALLSEDARRTVTDIAGRVNLSVAPVKRRIDRLERIGVIQGYTVLLDPEAAGVGMQAYVGVGTVAGEDGAVVRWLQGLASVHEIATVSGDEDLLLRLHLHDIHELQRVIATIRDDPRVVRTRISLVLGTWVRPR